LRFHTQTGGSTLTAQQPLNNVVRVALQALAAVMGGTQSLHTNGYDEALALPTEQAAALALRTQQIIAHESGAPRVADPLGGSYVVEYLTDQIVQQARALIAEVDARGGAVVAIEDGYVQSQIEEAAYDFQRRVEGCEEIVVGVNAFSETDESPVEILAADPRLEAEQVERLAAMRSTRDSAAVDAALSRLEAAAHDSDNLMYPMKSALAAHATIGEVSDVLRRVFGTFDGD
jgi:methylmalonyl-CoA mutase N-terminal domain/subunit